MRILAFLAVTIPGIACRSESVPEAAVRGKLTFDEETRLEYGVVPPPLQETEIAEARAELDRLLPGKGPLFPRYASFQRRLLVPPEKLERALTRALEECRRRTLEHIELPAEESIQIQFVSGASWPSFTRYLGNSRSAVQINRDFPLAASNLLEIASHEAYPGHHVLNVLRGNLEPPQGREAFVHEGLAGYGVDLAFPGDERLRFEKDVLYPLAGLDPGEAELYSLVAREVRRLAPLRVEAARSYLDGKRDRVQSVLFLENQALVPAPWTFLQFVDRYRTYVVAYTLGFDEVRRRIVSGSSDPWREYVAILTESSDET
jgi:hypothetical protein